MNNKLFLIIAEVGDGQDFRYTPRFYFEDEAEALALSHRLNQAATSTYSLEVLPVSRRGATHDALHAAALGVLQSADPEAVSTVRYLVKSVDVYVASVEGAPRSQAEAVFRAIRDLG